MELLDRRLQATCLCFCGKGCWLMSVEMIGYVLLAAAANVAGGFIIFVRKDWSDRGMHALMALSAGLLLAIAVLDLIPEVVPASPLSPVFILVGILIIFFTQQFVMPHSHVGKNNDHIAHFQGTVASSTVGMLIHTFFDGFSIVASFELDFRLGITVFVALLLHKIPDGITISSIVFSLTQNKKKALGSAILMGVSTLGGAVLGWLLTGVYFPNEMMLVVALSISAGIFLYVAGTDLLPSINAARDRLLPLLVFLGILIYFLLQLGLEWLVTGFH